jgi:hypothetical protein
MRPYISSMRNGVRNRGISWSGIGRTLLVEILVLLALSFAVVRYLEWSSDANQAEFMSATSHRRLIRIIPANFQLRFRSSTGEPVAIGRLELLQEPQHAYACMHQRSAIFHDSPPVRRVCAGGITMNWFNY